MFSGDGRGTAIQVLDHSFQRLLRGIGLTLVCIKLCQQIHRLGVPPSFDMLFQMDSSLIELL